jgi:hypothetical protein
MLNGIVAAAMTQIAAKFAPIVIVTVLAVIAGAQTTAPHDSPATQSLHGDGGVIRTTDGTAQITVPPGWFTRQNIETRNSLVLENRPQNAGLSLGSERKDIYLDGVTLDGHAKSIIAQNHLLEVMDIQRISEPRHLTINGYPAVQFGVRGTSGGRKIYQLFTSIETPTRFHQITASTDEDHLQQMLGEVMQIVQSFREIDPPATQP